MSILIQTTSLLEGLESTGTKNMGLITSAIKERDGEIHRLKRNLDRTLPVTRSLSFPDLDNGEEYVYTANRTYISCPHGEDYTMYYVITSQGIDPIPANKPLMRDFILDHVLPKLYSDFDRHSEQCEHEHDCCGNIYANAAYVEMLDEGFAMVRQSFVRNV